MPLRGRWAGAILFIVIMWLVILWLIQQNPTDWVFVIGIGIVATVIMICDIPIRDENKEIQKNQN